MEPGEIIEGQGKREGQGIVHKEKDESIWF
jgi:hypothetical protein